MDESLSSTPAVNDGLYVTRNSEYRIAGGVCVEVRDRGTGGTRPNHEAVGVAVEGVARLYSNGVKVPTREEPKVGDVLVFTRAGADGEPRSIVTSSLVRIDARPASSPAA